MFLGLLLLDFGVLNVNILCIHSTFIQGVGSLDKKVLGEHLAFFLTMGSEMVFMIDEVSSLLFSM